MIWLGLFGVSALALVAGLAWWRSRDILSAVDDALLGLIERDYAVRLVPSARGLEVVGRRFNQLGEQLRVEHAERYQRELLLETVLEATAAAVILFDARELVVFDNVAARELFFGGARLVGHALQEVGDRAPAELRAMLSGTAEGLVTVEKDGAAEVYAVTQRRLELRHQPHRLVVVKPLTRELERKEADAWKRAIRVMSHEINNSLAPIVSLVHTARRIAERPEHAGKLEQAFDTIAERAAHLQRFLDGYAQFARLPRPVRQPLRWGTLLEPLRPLYPFTVEASLPEGEAQLDPAQLQHVLVNLLKNAHESGSAVEAVSVAVRSVERGHLLEVRDHGSGLSEEGLRQALVPFYSTKKSGTGLGLPLCREIVEAHGGHLTIESRPGQGTTVRCFFPEE